MKIAISGHSGCGNTTATRNVGQALQLDIVNFTFRDLAQELGIGFDELHSKSPDNAIFDYLTDLKLIRSALKNKIVVGSRLAAWLMDADLRIWLHATLEARADRINKRESEKHSSYEAVLYKTLKRDEQNRKRYLKLYGLDINDHGDFDVTINTGLLTAEQVSGLIGAAAQWARSNRLERANLHLPRIRRIIADNLQINEDCLTRPEAHVDLKQIYETVQHVRL